MAPLKPPIDRSEDISRRASTVRIDELNRPDIDAVEREWGLGELCWVNRVMLWRLAWRTFLISLIVVFVLPKTWVSNARLMPPEQTNGNPLTAMLSMKAGDALPQGLSDLLPNKSSGAVFVGVLQSETVQNRLIDKFDLRRVYHVSTYERARQILEGRTNVVEDRRSGIISISVWDRGQVRSRDLCAAYVEELNRLVAELSTSSARRERIFLEGRLKEIKAELGEDEKRLSQFSSKNTTFDLSIQGKAMLESAAALQGELAASESELQGLEAIYTDNNARVRSLKARVAELQHQLLKLGGAGPDGAGSSTDQSALPYPSIRQLPILGVTYADLYRQVKVDETVYEVLTKQYELARVQEAKEIPTIRVLDQPLVPEKKSSPKRMQLIFASTVLAFLAGVAWLAIRRAWHRTDPTNPNKLLLQEIARSAQSTLLQRKNALMHVTRDPRQFWHRKEPRI